MIVIDNFLGIPTFEHLRDEMLGSRFPWTYSDIKSKGTDEEINHFGNQQMYHMHYGFDHMIHKETSGSISLVWPLLQILKPLALLRIKSNLQFG